MFKRKPTHRDVACSLCGETISYPLYLNDVQVAKDLTEKGWMFASPVIRTIILMGQVFQWDIDKKFNGLNICPDCQPKITKMMGTKKVKK